MILAIDEVGDFGLLSKGIHYFVGIHIDQNKDRLGIKHEQFRKWESGMPGEVREKGEVKGRLLSDEQLVAFYEQVIAADARVLISAVGTAPSQNTSQAIAIHLSKEVEAITRVIDHHTAQGNPSAATYRKMLVWYRNLGRRPDMYLKLKCLEQLIRISVPYTLKYAQLRCFLDKGDEANIRDLTIKIDKDYVRAANTMMYWREHLRQSLLHTRGSFHIKILPMWTRDTAPLYHHYPRVGANGVDMRVLFQKRLAFFDSGEHWELRIADIFATILHRVTNRGRLTELRSDIDRILNDRIGNVEHFIFTDTPKKR